MNLADNAMDQARFANAAMKTTYKMSMVLAHAAAEIACHALEQQKHAHHAAVASSYQEPRAKSVIAHANHAMFQAQIASHVQVANSYTTDNASHLA